ncbi:hypothetical protein [Solitalea canadensis]|uniref:Uncharacterized protein n=1 Tax=Solitalea canadensis (strain ATCC 29591 / DSM 3403 / JCM 21819 / LMG 8368 / NBRC 15130 / NCIMB 12057 / USAM 9D) TaxID=929556 RepID=H8KUJ8_SOLCM|nr:hypothetical protein [Solitalea canadensis]AFD07422.1 hypothetical protein Solca_2381 [Solitalea canadensis DSM 3403]
MIRFTTILILLIASLSCKNQSINEIRIKKIGQALIQIDATTDRSSIHDITYVGEGLLNEISQLKIHSNNRYEHSVRSGDIIKPFGDNTADCILTIDTDYKDIEIRLVYNPDNNKYDILGWRALAKNK